jgi:hypothetical protein
VVRIRSDEEWARRCISAALGEIDVVHHDDGSVPGMHDLEISYVDRPPGAVEVTAAADAESIELWHLVNSGERWRVPSLAGGWIVEMSPRARARGLKADLPTLLKQLEQAGYQEAGFDRRRPGLFDDAAAALGITRLSQGGIPGSIYFTIDLASERSGGLVGDTGDPLAEWLGEWLHEPDQAPNLEKLVRSGAREHHLFIMVPGFSVAPFRAAYLLMENDAPLPTIPPRLPSEVTHIWAMSTWNSGDGMRWSPESGWKRFDKLLDPEKREDSSPIS